MYIETLTPHSPEWVRVTSAAEAALDEAIRLLDEANRLKGLISEEEYFLPCRDQDRHAVQRLRWAAREKESEADRIVRLGG